MVSAVMSGSYRISNPAASQGFARCARFTLGYSHAVGFADWLNGFIIEADFLCKADPDCSRHNIQGLATPDSRLPTPDC